ncbi:DNA double-strand break repair protein Rad50 [Candidatus Phytoplasma asteris]|uniref:DNA double-strand break repair Rad50 ATPase n=2 Tax=16SrI (Aster yellows group) TaxID=3042590 RepID=A0A859I910_9MOLU|nr:MAG: DNA double-strand break repair Rad50 ATPase [Rapeseed phyllody phytoplasma]
MKTPLDLIKTYLTFKSYFTWFLMASVIFGIVLFFKRKLSANQTNKKPTWKGYLTSFLIIIGVLGFIYLCFFYKPKEPSSKYVGQLINEIDKAIDKYDEIINNYQGLKDNWEQELTKMEAELKELHKAQELTQEQKAKIKEALDKNEDKIKEIKKQLKNTSGNITILKGQLQQKEAELNNKDKEIKDKQEELKITTNTDDKKRLQDEIQNLQGQTTEIVEQIMKIKREIANLEATREKYEANLSNAIKLRDSLQRDYDKLTSGEQKLFNQIKSIEQRRTEIQNNINEIKEKQAAIEVRKKGLETIRAGADAARQNLTAWDKTHEFSFGNLRDAIFQGAELFLDAYGGRGMLRAVGGGITKKDAGIIAKGGLIVHEVHRAVHFAQQLMQNEDGTPKMMDQQTFETITKRIEKELDEAKADFKDSEKKLEEYKICMEDNNLKNKMQVDKKQLTEFKKQDESVIKEYNDIIENLIYNKNLFSDVTNKHKTKNELEEKLEVKNVEIDARKEELKNKSPNYARAQERIKQKRYNKFLQPITN